MIRLRFLACGLAFFAAVAFAEPPRAALPAGLAEVTSVEGITEYRLANGLQVLLVPDAGKPTTTVNVTYHVGSRMESYGETGMAHLLEHLMFKGTPTTKDVWAEFGRRGLRANGSTSFDRTNYFASFAANDETLRWYLGWQADAMVHSFIARRDLDSEMTVVRNEMEAGENNPQRILLQQTMAAMYQWHNYGKATIGARVDVEKVDIARLQAFYRRYYQPDNATLIVAGRFDPGRTLQWIAAAFGPIPKPARVLEPTYTLDPTQDGERTVTLRRRGGAPLVYVGYHVPAGPDPDFAALDLLSQVLGDSASGRLRKRLVEPGLAASAFSFAWGLAEPGPFFVGAQLAPGQDPERARAELLAAVDALAAQPVTEEELERARRQWLNRWDLGFTDPETVGVELSDAIAQGDWRLYFVERNQVRAVTLADIRRVAGQYLVRDNRTVGVYLPTEAPERAPAPARVDLAALLKDFRSDAGAVAAEAFDATPANLDARTERKRLASGLAVGLLPKSARGQVVQARLRLRFGTLESLRGSGVESALLAALLDKGGAGLSRQQIADRFDALRADVSFGGGEQSVDVAITARRETIGEVVALVARLLREPALPREALDEVRAQQLAALERQREEPGARVANALARHGNPYLPDDPRYVPTFDETAARLKAVDVDALGRFQRRHYSAAHGEFAAVGDFDAPALERALAAAFGDWRRPAAGSGEYVRIPHPLVAVAPKRFVIETPDKQNATMRAQLALPVSDTDADYPALMLASYMLGGNGDSRLWKRIRQTEGLSYDVRTGIEWNPYEPNSRFHAAAIFAPQNRPRVEAAFADELERARRDGFTQAELDAARTGLLNLRRLARAQDEVVVGQLELNLELDRRFELSQRVDDALAAATLADVDAALRKYIDPARWSIGWGGDFKDPSGS
jgi:zinc protease